MSVYVCPAAVVAAPCATVWEVLRNIPFDTRWIGSVEVQSAVPPGPLQPGQALMLGGKGYARRLSLRMEIDAVDEAKGFVDIRVMLPLGMVNHEHMTLAPVIDGGRPACRVQFG